MADNVLTHAREFTTIEVQGLTLWNALQDAGQTALARDLLDATLMHEHFTSLLDNDVSKRTADQLATQAQLRSVFDSFVQQAQKALAGVVDTRGASAGG